MQKARRHPTKGPRPLAGAWFQGLFHSPARGSFHLSLTVLVRYRSLGSVQPFGMVPDNSAGIPRAPAYSGPGPPGGGLRVRGSHPLRPAVPDGSARLPPNIYAGPITPARALRRRRFGLVPFRSPLLGESLLLSSPGGTEMFQFPPFAPRMSRGGGIAAAGLPHSDIRGSRDICSSPRLFAACRVLLRLREPRHPPCALVRSVFSFPDSGA